jgi:4-aminobutyrate aminotransferase/(S)-3-amino-2-methylpropionate transaminase
MVVKAIQERAAKFTTPVSWCALRGGGETCEKALQAGNGDSPKRAILINSGAEAVENAVKVAR